MSSNDPLETTGRTSNGASGQDTESMTDKATSALSGVATQAGDSAKDVAGQAAEQLTNVAQQAKTQLTGLVDQTKEEVRQQAQTKGEQAAGALRSLSDQLQALSSGRPAEAGQLTSYLDDVRERVIGFATTLEQRGPQGLVDDVARYARRKPGMFLLMAGVAGFSVGRLVRAAAAANHESSSNGSVQSEGQYGMHYSSPTVRAGGRAELTQSNMWAEPEPMLDVVPSASSV
jgi:ElaB/YqjD/DUF883 family membrane-anchored ribosome-binding protein